MPPSPTCMRHPILFFQPSYPALVCISCGPNRGRVWAHDVSVATQTAAAPPPLPLPPQPPPTSQAQSCTHLSRSRGRTAPDPYPGRTRLRTSNSFCAEHRHHCHIYVWRAICGRRRGYIEASRLCRGVEATSRRRGVEESRSLMRRIVVTGSDSTKASRSRRGHVEAPRRGCVEVLRRARGVEAGALLTPKSDESFFCSPLDSEI